MTKRIKDDLRMQIIQFLPEALDKALMSYRLFASQLRYKKTTDFKAHHDAGKVALAHVELLLKLAKWVEPELSKSKRDHDVINLEEMIVNARQEVRRHNKMRGDNQGADIT